MEEELHHPGIQTDFARVEGETRINLAITDGRSEIKVNEAGPPIGADARAALLEKVRAYARTSAAVVLTGSLPPGAGPTLYAELIGVVRKEGAGGVLDAEGEPLAQGIGARPYLIKPNLAEAETLLRISLTMTEEIRRAAIELVDRGIDIVVISLGERGALMACARQAWLAEIPHVQPVSTVGAGDSLLARLLLLLLEDIEPPAALRVGVAAGLASAMLPGSWVCTPADVERLISQVTFRTA